MICPTVFGFDLCLNKNGGHWVYYLGFYELGTLSVLKECLRPGDTLVDVGSSIGLMTTVGSLAVGPTGQVIAFEPDEERFSCLLSGLRLNSRENVLALQFAVGSEPGVARLYQDRSSPSLVPKVGSTKGSLVQIIRLDDVLKERGIRSVRFIKIDVEGFEANVLIGAKRILGAVDAPILCIERNLSLCSADGEADRALELVAACNDYAFYQLRGTSHTRSQLCAVSSFADLHGNDNVYCLTPRNRATVPQALFA